MNIKRKKICAFGIWLFFIFGAGTGLCRTEHEVHFENTEYELNIYKIYGAENGKTMMIIGGIQGDEPGGYLSADLYADMALRRGKLIVVPRANFFSIIEHKRAINRDMNRRFTPVNSKEFYEDKIVEILKGLIAKSDYLLNLHEGSGFFSEEWESDLKNPMRFGQSIIADADVYHSNEKGIELRLGDTAKKVADDVNKKIDNQLYHFRFNNHRTFEKDSSHPEQRKSATFYALSTHGIPAFGVETSKQIKDLETKVRLQSMVINAFMDEFGIIPENPKVALDTPRLKYLVVSLNGSQNMVAKDGDEIRVKKGERIRVSQIEANYERGLNVDILGAGTANDYQKEIEIQESTKAIVRKDGFKCGEVYISVIKDEDNPGLVSELKNNYPGASKELSSKSPGIIYLILELNGSRRVLVNGEHIKTIRGDRMKLLDVIAEGINANGLTVNFLGFVGNKIKNTGEDRGYTINTAKDLWIKYSKGGNDLQYSIAINNADKRIGEIFVDIEEPRLNYLVVKHSQGGQRWYASGETIFITPNDVMEIVDIKTNINGNSGVKVHVTGDSGEMETRVITGYHLSKGNTGDKNGAGPAIIVSRDGMVMGKTAVQVGEPVAVKENN